MDALVRYWGIADLAMSDSSCNCFCRAAASSRSLKFLTFSALFCKNNNQRITAYRNLRICFKEYNNKDLPSTVWLSGGCLSFVSIWNAIYPCNPWCHRTRKIHAIFLPAYNREWYRIVPVSGIPRGLRWNSPRSAAASHLETWLVYFWGENCRSAPDGKRKT